METIHVDVNRQYQTMQGFGASAGWWAQKVGGYTQIGKSGKQIREEIMELLYGHSGLEMEIYRYNLGAGTHWDNGEYSDTWKHADSFLSPDGEMDYSRDQAAQWCMFKALELGAKKVIFFCNSAPDSMTVNKKAHSSKPVGDEKPAVNLSPENYQRFCDYVLDAVEHFKQLGVPVAGISPINEPQWEWSGGQEGCHYTPKEVVNIYRVFLSEMERRGMQEKLCIFESGQCHGEPLSAYLDEIMSDPKLSSYIESVDTHTYWSTAKDKQNAFIWLKDNYPSLTFSCTEWTEMTPGVAMGMDSALILANTIWEDLCLLNSSTWQYWVAVSAFDWHDGFIYIDRDSLKYDIPKRMWAYANFTKFIRSQSVRIECVCKHQELRACAFRQGEKQVIVTIINNSTESIEIELEIGTPAKIAAMYVTDEDRDLALSENYRVQGKSGLWLTPQSVTTFVLNLR